MAHAYVVGTFDTKGDELRYVADLIRDAGHEVTTVDVGTSDAGARRADVTAADVAGPEAFTGDRGSSVAAMAAALEAWLPQRTDLDGVIGLGGSGGTALITPALQRLPVGVPKIVVSTVASGERGALRRVERHRADVLGHRRRRAQPDQPRGARQRRPRSRGRPLGAPARPRRGPARARTHHVRGDDAVRHRGDRGPARRVRLPGLPRHRHRRAGDGEARRRRPGVRGVRRVHHRDRRPRRRRGHGRDRGPARRDRPTTGAVGRERRRARHGQLRGTGHRPGALPRPAALRAQRPGDPDAHHARRVPGRGGVPRPEAQRLRGTGAPGGAAARCLGPRRRGRARSRTRPPPRRSSRPCARNSCRPTTGV